MYLLHNRLCRTLAILSLLATSAIVACSDSVEGPIDSGPSVTAEPTFSFLQQEVFNPSCALSGCHAGSRRPDLRAGIAFGSIVDVASSRGTPYITAGDPQNSYLYLKVTGGSGISAENMNRLFDPGFTTKGVRVGTGLGLSISYNIIAKHGGDIRVESEEGKGAQFTVCLPRNLREQLVGNADGQS